ncbi:MAG: hypothetical protein ACYCT7_08770 [bacterium]
MKNPFINENKENSKIDSFLIHSMPFLPVQNRKKDFEIVRSWGKQFIKITAPETLNAYDLISLLQFLRHYIQNRKNYKEFNWGNEGDKKVLFGCEIDLSEFCRERNISDNKHNRETIFNSFKRIFEMKIELGEGQDLKNKSLTRFIYDIEPDKNKEYKKINVLVNKLFFEFCLKKGLMINLDKLIRHQKNYYAILLDAFIQSTDFEKYDEELLFERTGLSKTGCSNKDKREVLKKAFSQIDENKKYSYDKKYKKWIKKEISLSEFIAS